MGNGALKKFEEEGRQDPEVVELDVLLLQTLKEDSDLRQLLSGSYFRKYPDLNHVDVETERLRVHGRLYEVLSADSNYAYTSYFAQERKINRIFDNNLIFEIVKRSISGILSAETQNEDDIGFVLQKCIKLVKDFEVNSGLFLLDFESLFVKILKHWCKNPNEISQNNLFLMITLLRLLADRAIIETDVGTGFQVRESLAQITLNRIMHLGADIDRRLFQEFRGFASQFEANSAFFHEYASKIKHLDYLEAVFFINDVENGRFLLTQEELNPFLERVKDAILIIYSHNLKYSRRVNNLNMVELQDKMEERYRKIKNSICERLRGSGAAFDEGIYEDRLDFPEEYAHEFQKVPTSLNRALRAETSVQRHVVSVSPVTLVSMLDETSFFISPDLYETYAALIDEYVDEKHRKALRVIPKSDQRELLNTFEHLRQTLINKLAIRTGKAI